jgi:hypothetical protein
MSNATLGASTTFAIGDTDTGGCVRYLEATATSSAARTEFPSVGKIAGVPFTITQDCWLQAVTGKVVCTVLIARAGGLRGPDDVQGGIVMSRGSPCTKLQPLLVPGDGNDRFGAEL